MNKISIHFGYWYRGETPDYRQLLNNVKAAGADCLEVDPRMLMELPDGESAKLLQYAKDLGLDFTYCGGLPLDADMASEDEKSREKGIRLCKETLDFIRSMGGNNYAGVLYSVWPLQPKDILKDKSDYIARSVDSFKQVAAHAEKHDMFVSQEIVNRFEQFIINTTDEGLDFIERVGSPNNKLLLDIFHMNIEEDDIAACLRKAGNHLGHLHVGECNRKVIGTVPNSRMPWNDIFAALKDINYSGTITLESFVLMGSSFAKNICLWRDLSNGADDAKLLSDITAGVSYVRSKLQ